MGYIQHQDRLLHQQTNKQNRQGHWSNNRKIDRELIEREV